MAVKEKALYKGRRRQLNIMGFVLFIIAVCIVAAFLAFYSFQKYLVYEPDGISLELPILSSGGSGGETDDSGFSLVTASVTVNQPDYGSITATAGEGTGGIEALFVPAEYVTTEGLERYKSVMSMYGATGLVLEVKPASGQLLWQSEAELSLAYSTSGSTDLAAVVSGLKEDGIYVAAQLSCCLDSLLAERGSSLALKNALGGALSSEEGMWLDPYSSAVRQYIIELCEELAAMGFDELVLDNICLPVTESAVSFTVSLSFTPSPTTAVCGFARDVARSLDSLGIPVCAVLEGATLHDGQAEQTGQDATLFAKVFDRLCCEAETAWQYGVDRDSVIALMELGDASMRYASLMAFIPDGAESWIVLVPEALVSTTAEEE